MTTAPERVVFAPAANLQERKLVLCARAPRLRTDQIRLSDWFVTVLELPAFRKISERCPTSEASDIFCAWNGVTSSVTAFATTARSFCSVRNYLINCDNFDVLKQQIRKVFAARSESDRERMRTTSTRSFGRINPATPRTSSTRIVIARLS